MDRFSVVVVVAGVFGLLSVSGLASAQDAPWQDAPTEAGSAAPASDASGEGAAGEAAPGAASSSAPSLSASAAEAQRRADEAAAQLEAARRALEEAELRASEAEARAAEETARASDPVLQAQEAARRAEARAAEAEERAEHAQDRALKATREARELQGRLDPLEERLEALERQLSFGRKGFYVGAGGMLAPETFGEGISADDSRGLWARIGYRFDEHASIEGRYDWLDEFDAAGNVAAGTVRPSLMTLNVRAFPWTGRIQPYVGLGIGAASARVRATRFEDGARFSERRTTGVLRPAAGLDLYVSPNILLNFDAAYAIPHEELREFRFGTLAAGVEFRF